MEHWDWALKARLDDAYNEGLELAHNELAALYTAMEADGASAEELSRAVQDPAYREKMYEKYNIPEQ